MEWLLNRGQEFLGTEGYAELVPSESRSNLRSLQPIQVNVSDSRLSKVAVSSILIVVAIACVLALMVYLVFRRRSSTAYFSPAEGPGRKGIKGSSLEAPGGIFFDRSHTWAFMEKDGLVRTGVDDFLQHVTGPITKVMHKEPGETIKRGESFITLIQHGKNLVLYAPVSGTIRSFNSELTAYPDMINESPFSKGWLYLIEPDHWLKETRTFLMADRYREWLREEFNRLKNFLSGVLQPVEVDQKHLILQDGGELRDCLLECLGPEVWEEFQARFVDGARS
jgi:glycine cleavage system H lipoate-binding protein